MLGKRVHTNPGILAARMQKISEAPPYQPKPAAVSAAQRAPRVPAYRPATLTFIGGERLRGVLIAVGVLGLFFGGMLIGGIDVIDSREDRVWFFGQALVGPTAFAVDWAHQTQFKVIDPNTRQLRTAYPGEGRDANGMAVAAERMEQAQLDPSFILFAMWTESLRQFAQEGTGNAIFLDGSVDGMAHTLRQLLALNQIDRADGAAGPQG